MKVLNKEVLDIIDAEMRAALDAAFPKACQAIGFTPTSADGDDLWFAAHVMSVLLDYKGRYTQDAELAEKSGFWPGDGREL